MINESHGGISEDKNLEKEIKRCESEKLDKFQAMIEQRLNGVPGLSKFDRTRKGSQVPRSRPLHESSSVNHNNSI